MKKLLLAFLLAASCALAQSTKVVDTNNLPTWPVGTTNIPLMVDSYGRIVTTGSSGAGTVTSVSVTTANGVSGSVATATTTPAITLTLGAITPSSVASTGAVSGTSFTDSGLTSGRVPFVSTGGLLADASTMTFSSGTLTLTGGLVTGSGGATAGAVALGQGTAPAAGTTNVTIYAPTSVTSYIRQLPGAAATGFYYGTNTAGSVVDTQVAASGTGSVALTNGATFVAPVLGTPASGTVTNLTGTASININGTVGATTPAAGTFTSISNSGSTTFTGTGNRITGDMTNATAANRVLFQTSTTNSTTATGLIPSGSGTQTNWILYAGSDPANTSFLNIKSNATETMLDTNAAGSGTTQPLTIKFGGTTVLTISSAAVAVTGTLSATTPTFNGTSYTTATASSVGYIGMPQNSQSTAYTTVLTDQGKHILHPTADNNARTITIDSNANVAYPIGTVITVVNQINTVTIAITSDTLTWFAGSGTASTGSRTLAAGGVATLLKVGTTSWIITGPGVSFEWFDQPKFMADDLRIAA